MPSAGDVERFGYCAHNWWLARQGHDDGHRGGIEAHRALGRKQQAVEHTKKEATEWLNWAFRILAAAGSVTFLTLELVFLRAHPLHWAFLLVALVMVSMSAGLLVMHLVTQGQAEAATRKAGLVPGQLEASDLEGTSEPLVDPVWGISGAPDYVIRTERGAIPVEFKSGKTPDRPFDSHVLQIACYLRLLEAQNGQVPEYGLITYPQGTFRVDWNDDVKAYLKGTLDRMARAEAEGRADRDHDQPGRCRGCARRDVCDERLV